MSAFRQVTHNDLNEAMRDVLAEELAALIGQRQAGHCMRLSDLDTEVMLELTESLRQRTAGGAQIYVLTAQAKADDPRRISGSKLVELRNPLPDGSQRPPLLVFVPNELKAACEDSFAEATFEQLSMQNTYIRLCERLVANLPNGLQFQVPEVLRIVTERQWRWAEPVALVRFLLSIRANGYDNEVVGASLFELGLVPDFHLLENPASLAGRLTRNIECV